MRHSFLCAASGGFDIQGALIIALFLVMIALMYTRKLSALLALPTLGVGVALIGALPHAAAISVLLEGGGIGAAWRTLGFRETIVDEVIGGGSTMLKDAYTIAIIGGMLAILIREKRIAETLIKYAAELSGDNPVLVALMMMLVVSMLFTSMGGLGAIIMTGTIVFPIMMSLGIAPLTAAGIFLIALSAGGTLNPGNWALYENALGLGPEKVQAFAFIVMVLYFLTGLVFVATSLRVGWRRWVPRMRAMTLTALIAVILAGAVLWRISPTLLLSFLVLIGLAVVTLAILARPDPRGGVRPIALLAPIVPILLSFKFTTIVDIAAAWRLWALDLLGAEVSEKLEPGTFARAAAFWDDNIGAWSYTGAFIAGLVFTFIFTYDRRKPNIQILTKAIIVGAESVIPAVLLMIGLGMVLKGLWNEDVRGHLAPHIRAVVPSGQLGYVLVFGLLAPLALYRGPLNVWGLGLGVAGLIYSAGKMGALPVMAVFMSVGAIQSVCDPTNTHNIWIGAFIGEDVMRILKKTLPFMWGMAVAGLVVAAIFFKSEMGPEAYLRENPDQAAAVIEGGAAPSPGIRVSPGDSGRD
jgi:hypothetical protein